MNEKKINITKQIQFKTKNNKQNTLYIYIQNDKIITKTLF